MVHFVLSYYSKIHGNWSSAEEFSHWDFSFSLLTVEQVMSSLYLLQENMQFFDYYFGRKLVANRILHHVACNFATDLLRQLLSSQLRHKLKAICDCFATKFLQANLRLPSQNHIKRLAYLWPHYVVAISHRKTVCFLVEIIQKKALSF